MTAPGTGREQAAESLARHTVGEVTISYRTHGTGIPLVVLHGAGVDHREVEAAVEALEPGAGIRRIYPDLPGLGRSTATGLTSNDDVVTCLARFVADLTAEPALVLGHSYGAYLARGMVARRPDLFRGLALCCPVGERASDVPEHQVVRHDADAHGELEPDQRSGFDEYFVVRTADTARRYRQAVVPALGLADTRALEPVVSNWALHLERASAGLPTLVLAGRRDSVAGYRHAVELAEEYEGATLAVIEDAGHALLHEQPAVVGALLRHWLERAAGGLGPLERPGRVAS